MKLRNSGLSASLKRKESDDEKDFVRWCLKEKRCIALKLIILGKRGFPDRTILTPGPRVLFVEMKRGDGALSPQQRLLFSSLRGLGFTVEVCYSFTEAKTALEKFLEKTDKP